MKSRWGAIFGLLIFLTVPAVQSADIYFGAFVENDLSSLADITAFETNTQKPVSIIHVFSAWGSSTGQDQFPTTWVNTIRSNGSIPMVTWEPWKPTDSATNQPNYQLADITAGTYDAYITDWALDAKAWGHPLFLRFAHEMNGNWYPWSEAVNSNTSGQYILAWQHVHDIFTANNVTNITWVWCPNKNFTGSLDIDGLYPGDSYVDWTCMDGYNRGTNGGNTWQTFNDLFGSTYTEIRNINDRKPMMIGEVGTVEEGGSKAGWFTDTLGTVIPDQFPKIKAFIYFNKFKVYDNTIQTSPGSIAAFAAAIGASRYASNSYGSISGAPIQPPTPETIAGTLYADDSFARAVSNNWSAADVGGAYTLSGTFADFDMNNLGGMMQVNGAGTGFLRSATLNTVSAEDVDMTVRVKTNKTAAGSSQFAMLLGRSVASGDQYRGRLRQDTGGNIHLQAAKRISGTETFLGTEITNVGTYAVDTFTTVRMRIEGTNPTTIRLKAWRSTTSEPADWQYEVEDNSPTLQEPGGVGLHSRLNFGSTNAPVIFTYDDFRVTSIATPTPTPTITPTATPGFGTDPAPSPTGAVPTGTPSGSGGPTSLLPEPPPCSDTKPSAAPDLFQIDRDGSTATLHFTPAGNPVSGYVLAFSENSSAEHHGASFSLSSTEGVQSYTVFALDPETPYYFKIRAQNGCKPGDWSTTLRSDSQ